MRNALLIVILLAATPFAASAGSTLGGSVGAARVNESDFNGSDTSFKFYLGNYGELFGGEIGYVNFGKLGGDGPIADAWAPALTLGIPLGGATLFGKFGVAFAEVDGSTLRPETRDQQAFFGIGFRAGSRSGLGLRAEYERFRIADDDVDMAFAGLEFRF